MEQVAPDSTAVSARQADAMHEHAENAVDAAVAKMLTAPEEARPDVAPDRRALVAYASWLALERNFIAAELYPHLGHRATDFVVGSNSGFDYHTRHTPPASMRAAAVLALVGCDWTADGYLGVGDGGPSYPSDPAFPHPDAHLIELHRVWRERHDTYEEKVAASLHALEEFRRREAPWAEADEVLRQQTDRDLFWDGLTIRQILSGRYLALTSREAAVADSVPRLELQQMLPVAERRDARIAALEEELRIRELEAEQNELLIDADKAACRLYRCPARTVEGLILKAELLRVDRPDLWTRDRLGHRHCQVYEIALAEIADSVKTLVTLSGLDRTTRLHRTRDEVSLASSLDVDLNTMLGGIAHPDGTVSFCDASGRVLRKPVADWIGFTVMRMWAAARTEMARQLCDTSLDEAGREALDDKLRRDLRLDALHILAFRSSEAFNSARAADDALPEVPRTRSSGAGVISPDLIQAMEAHRETRQLMLHDPVDDDARTEANMTRVRALGDAVRAIPARSLADLRYRLLYLWPEDLRAEVVDSEFAETLQGFHDDVCRLFQDQEPAPQAMEEDGPKGTLDLRTPGLVHDLSGCTGAQLARLFEAVREIWRLIGGAADAPCFFDSAGEDHNDAGRILDDEADRLAGLLEAINAEAARRAPATSDERDELLSLRLEKEILCNGRITDRALLSEAVAAWGG